MRLILELTPDQEAFLVCALQTDTRQAWEELQAAELALDEDSDPDRMPREKRVAYWSAELATGTAVLAQLPARALSSWRESLSDNGIDDNGEEGNW
jgi:hypothetical protein